MNTKQKTIIFVVLLFSVVFCKTLYSFTLTVDINHIKINQSTTITLDVSPGSPGDYTYEWSTDIGSIQGTSNIVTFNAPGSKGKATISVTASIGGNPEYTGSVSVLVYKSIVVIKCDDLWGNPDVPTKWADYVDYMENTAKVKSALGINFGVGSSNSTYFNKIKGWLSRGYVTLYCHGYLHNDYRTMSAQDQLDSLVLCEELAMTELGVPLEGFGAPGNNNNADTTWAMNQIPEMKFWFFNDMNGAPDFDGYNYHMATTRLNAETSSQHIDYSMYLSEYASKISRDINVIQIHPPWWSNPSDLNEWDRVITHLKSEGITIISPIDYVNMINNPAFVPDEGPGGSVEDTIPPVISNVNAINISKTGATITWDTNEPATSQVRFGLSSSYGSVTAEDSNLVTSHTAPLTGLIPEREYHYALVSRDASGNEKISGDYTFVTFDSLLSLTLTTLDFGEVLINKSKASSFTITNAGEGILSGTISDDREWITVNPTSFSNNNEIVWVVVKNNELADGQFSGTVTVDAGAAGTETITVTMSATCVFTRPNPYNPRSGNLIFFGSGVLGSTIKIYTLAGEPVRTLTWEKDKNDEDEIEWDGENESGYEVISGIYLYTTESDKEKNACSFTVIKK